MPSAIGDRQVFPVQMKRTVRIRACYLGETGPSRGTLSGDSKPKELSLDFLEFDRAWRTLTEEDVVTVTGDPPADLAEMQIDYDERRTAHRTIFAGRPGHEPDVADAEFLEIPRERAGEVLEHILHKLHLAPLVLLPIGRWRSVFDVVTPQLADNEQWVATTGSYIAMCVPWVVDRICVGACCYTMQSPESFLLWQQPVVAR